MVPGSDGFCWYSIPCSSTHPIHLSSRNRICSLSHSMDADFFRYRCCHARGYRNQHPKWAVLWENYEGNKWFWANPYGEYPIQTRMMWSDGSYTGINIVLVCTALQSMIVFIGAISVLNIDAKRKIRALILTVPTIHILNVFRNAGIIYLYDTFPDWQWMGIRMFEFAHTYAARVVSLFAMFLMATIMFQMLPEFHKHILNLLEPIAKARKLKQS